MAELGWIHDLAGRAFTGAVASATPLAGGEINETYVVTTTSGERIVCRRAPEEVADWHPAVESSDTTDSQLPRFWWAEVLNRLPESATGKVPQMAGPGNITV